MTEADWRMKAMADFFGAKFVRVDEDGEPVNDTKQGSEMTQAQEDLVYRVAELADQFACGAAGEPVVYALHGPTDFAEEVVSIVTAARDAEIRELLLTHADGYIVAKGQDGEEEAAFATKPWMEQILDHIGLLGDETGGQG